MLLRAIQERRYRPVGAKEDKTANVRIVAATKRGFAESRNGKAVPAGFALSLAGVCDNHAALARLPGRHHAIGRVLP